MTALTDSDYLKNIINAVGASRLHDELINLRGLVENWLLPMKNDFHRIFPLILDLGERCGNNSN